ncbi:tRNA (adenosine(37)-N6)-threonylcarbamoyltransferase complex transferase subunit TsaD, partial [Staphylococcus arlettae]
MNNETLRLAVESSCDETSISVIQNGTTILSNIVLSQIDSHKRFGGVVPEVASRHHVEGITTTIDEALKDADVTMEDIHAVAVTQGPGLIGALLVGINAAKALAFAYDKPLIPVHHIAGHIYANHLEEPLQFPLIALIVSGGHTELIYMKDHLNFEIIGETRDDAVGEAYDKVARTIGLSYPGGPQVDKLAATGNDTYDFPPGWLDKDSYDLS